MRTPRQRIITYVVVGALMAAALVVTAVLLARNTTSGAKTTVVVAARDIAPGVAITDADVVTEQRLETEVPLSATTDVSQVLGKYLGETLRAHSVVTTDVLAAAPGGPAGTAALNLPKGDVAVAIPYSYKIGFGGYVKNGDHIDIVVDTVGNGSLHYAFQDVPVLKVGAVGEAGVPSMLIVDVPRSEAKTLIYVTSLTGPNKPAIVGYVLRPAADVGVLPTTPFTAPSGDPALDSNQWNQLFGH